MASQLGLTQMITIEIKVPNRMVGLGGLPLPWVHLILGNEQGHPHSLPTVIGRQGEMINRLQADSAARIQVAPGEYSSTARCGKEHDLACPHLSYLQMVQR